MQYEQGAIIRGDSTRKEISIVFTADSFADGGSFIIRALKEHQVKGGFFFTGNFYDNPRFAPVVKQLQQDGHYLGPHSQRHLLYCDWSRRDSLLVTRKEFAEDLQQNLQGIRSFQPKLSSPVCFIPPFEWYNQQIADWAKQEGTLLFNYTPGLLTPADYTTPSMKNYRSSDFLWEQLRRKEAESGSGLNGFIILVHFGTDPARTDKFYHRLPALIRYLKGKGYRFVRIDDLLQRANSF